MMSLSERAVLSLAESPHGGSSPFFDFTEHDAKNISNNSGI
jgi:hypothetical protein